MKWWAFALWAWMPTIFYLVWAGFRILPLYLSTGELVDCTIWDYLITWGFAVVWWCGACNLLDDKCHGEKN